MGNIYELSLEMEGYLCAVQFTLLVQVGVKVLDICCQLLENTFQLNSYFLIIYVYSANYLGIYVIWRVSFRGTNCTRAKLSGAQLSGAQLPGAQLSGAQLSYAQLSGTQLAEAQRWEKRLAQKTRKLRHFTIARKQR